MFSTANAAVVTVQLRGWNRACNPMPVDTYRDCVRTICDLTGAETIRCNGAIVARYDDRTGWTTDDGFTEIHITIN